MTRRPSLPWPRTTPGSHRSTVSSSDSRFSPVSWSSTVATNVLVVLPIRTYPSRGTGRPVRRSPTPLRTVRTARDVSSRADTPVTPASRNASASRCSGVGRAAAVAVAPAGTSAASRAAAQAVAARRAGVRRMSGMGRP